MSQKFSEYLLKKRQQEKQDALKKNDHTVDEFKVNGLENENKDEKVITDSINNRDDKAESKIGGDALRKLSHLPPPISPTLPMKYIEPSHTNNQKVSPHTQPIPKLLSPTLPPKYDFLNNEPTLKKPKSVLDSDTQKENIVRQSSNGDYHYNSKNFEKVEHLGVHSYRYIKTPTETKLLLTLHVPFYYKKLKKENGLIGLGITNLTNGSKSKIEKSKNHTKASSDIMSDSQNHVVRKTLTKKDAEEKSRDVNQNGKGVRSNSNINDDIEEEELDDKPLVSRRDKTRTESSDIQTRLMKEKEKLLSRAKDKKHKGDELRHTNIKLAITYFMDCIITYLVGFSYEDQSRRLSKKLYNDQPWLSLISFIDNVLKLSRDNNIGDVVGLCLQIRTIVYEHISQIVTEFIQLDSAKRKKAIGDSDVLKIDDRITTNVKSLLKYRELSKRGLIQSEKNLSIFKLQSKYPQIVSSYQYQERKHSSTSSSSSSSTSSPSIKNRSNSDANNELVLLLHPETDDLQLPITQGVSLKEIASYSLKVISQWCKDENVRYDQWEF